MANNPKRGEIWLADLEPVVILSSNTVRLLPVRIVVPLTGWQEHFAKLPWKVRLEPDLHNQLSKLSAADCLQVRCLSVERFTERLGRLPQDVVQDMIDALNYCLEE